MNKKPSDHAPLPHHPVDAMKALGVPMTPEAEAQIRAICDEQISPNKYGIECARDGIAEEPNPLLRDCLRRLLRASEGIPANTERIIAIDERELAMYEPKRKSEYARAVEMFACSHARREIPAEEPSLDQRINALADKYHLDVTRDPRLGAIRFRAIGPHPVGPA
jgi:hypothetical protein